MIDQDDARAHALRYKVRTVIWEYAAEYGPFEGVELCLGVFHEELNEARQIVGDS